MNALASTLLGLFLFVPFLSQSPVPVGDEPRHHVKLQNEYVRVIDAVVPPGDTTLFHIHSADNVPVAISGGKSKTEPLGGQASEAEVLTGSVSYRRGSYTHRITNIGSTPLRFIDAEVLASPGSRPGSPSLGSVPGHKLALENERVRIYQLTLEPGQSTGLHTHSAYCLTVAISGGELSVATTGQTVTTDSLKPGDFRWRTAGVRHSIRNVGSSRFEAVDIEWK